MTQFHGPADSRAARRENVPIILELRSWLHARSQSQSCRARQRQGSTSKAHVTIFTPTKVVISVFAAILIPNEVMIYDLCPAGPRPNSKMTNIAQYKLWLVATVALFTQLGHFSSDADEGQVQDRVQRPPEAGAGEGVPLQPLHHHQEEGRARKHDRTFRETGIKHNAFEAPLKRVTTKIFLFYFALTYYF